MKKCLDCSKELVIKKEPGFNSRKRCKSCALISHKKQTKEYHQSEKGKISRQKYNQSNEALKAREKYKQSTKGRESIKKYQRSLKYKEKWLNNQMEYIESLQEERGENNNYYG